MFRRIFNNTKLRHQIRNFAEVVDSTFCRFNYWARQKSHHCSYERNYTDNIIYKNSQAFWQCHWLNRKLEKYHKQTASKERQQRSEASRERRHQQQQRRKLTTTVPVKPKNSLSPRTTISHTITRKHHAADRPANKNQADEILASVIQ